MNLRFSFWVVPINKKHLRFADMKKLLRSASVNFSGPVHKSTILLQGTRGAPIAVWRPWRSIEAPDRVLLSVPAVCSSPYIKKPPGPGCLELLVSGVAAALVWREAVLPAAPRLQVPYWGLWETFIWFCFNAQKEKHFVILLLERLGLVFKKSAVALWSGSDLSNWFSKSRVHVDN